MAGGVAPGGHADVSHLLRSRGLRATHARLLVMGAMRELDHPTIEALHRASEPEGVVLTTVYRTLETLERVGLVWAVHVPGIGRTYHLGTQHPHAHLLCGECGLLEDLAALPGSALAACGVPAEFAVDHVQLTVIGRCARCLDSPGGRTEGDLGLLAHELQEDDTSGHART